MRRKLLLVLSIILIFSSSVIAAPKNDISVVLDDVKLKFDVAPQIIEDRTLVPVRVIFEELGAKVEWNGITKTVRGIKDDKEIKLNIDSNIAYINGNEVEIDVPAKIIKDRTLVPVRFISEAFGSEVEWNGKTKTINIRSNPKENSLGTLSLNGNKITLGMSKNQLENLFGQPKRIDKALNGGQWYIYNNAGFAYENYIQVKVLNDRVTKIQTNSKNWKIGDTSHSPFTSNTSDLVNKAKSEKGFYEDYIKVITRDDDGNSKENINKRKEITNDDKSIYIEVLGDKSSGKVSFITVGLMSDDKDTINISGNGLVGILKPYDEEIIKGMERQVLDYTNVIRLKNGKAPLQWHDGLRELAKGHSTEMAKYNYFSHDDFYGEDFPVRFIPKAQQYGWMSGAENIAGGIYDSAGITNLWYNSEVHRANILADFDYLGVGISYGLETTYGLYYTQNFAGTQRIEN